MLGMGGTLGKIEVVLLMIDYLGMLVVDVFTPKRMLQVFNILKYKSE